MADTPSPDAVMIADGIASLIIAHVQQVLRDYDIPEETIINDPEIASSTREACSDSIARAIDAAKREEREACAKVADDLGDSDKNDAALHNEGVSYSAGYEMGCREVAASIRSRISPPAIAKEVAEGPLHDLKEDRK